MPDQQQQQVIRFFIPAHWRDLATLDDRIAIQEWMSGEVPSFRAMKELLAKFVCDEHNKLLGEREGRKIVGSLRGEQAIADAFSQFIDALMRAIVPPPSGSG